MGAVRLPADFIGGCYNVFIGVLDVLEILQDLSQILIWVLGIIIIGLVLLQGGAGDVSSAFGGGGQLDSALGVGANRKLAKITGMLSFLFVVMIVILAMPREGDFTASEAAVATGGESTEAASAVEAAPVEKNAASSEEAVPVTKAVVGEVVSEEEAPAVAEAAAETVQEAAAKVTAPAEGSGVSFGDDDEAAAEAETPP